MTNAAYLKKGDHVRARWFGDGKAVALAGVQMKFQVSEKTVEGTVTHIRGDHPVNPTKVEIWVQPDSGGDEVVIKPEWVLQ